MQISAIIPVVNDHSRIEQAIERAWEAGADEVIVVDGQSSDGTYELAKKSNCSLFQSTPGRANQQNHGVRQATGVVVLFLHVDNWLAVNACEQIRNVMQASDVHGGAFKQVIDSPKRTLRWIESGNANRVRWFNLAYGDQAIFVRRACFLELGGFPDVPFLEDYMFSQRLRRLGDLALLPGPLHVDARRWEKNGAIRQTLKNWAIIAAYRLGVSPQRLARFYARHDHE